MDGISSPEAKVDTPQKNTLIPEGIVIDIQGNPLEIIKRIGEGYTAEVYKASYTLSTGQVMVAVKAMKPSTLQDAGKRFEDESSVLFLLNHEEERAIDSKFIRVVPKNYYFGEYGKQEQIPYIVMEYIQGKDIPSLLKNGRLSEEQSLHIGWYFFRFLNMLHTKLQRSYVDLKFDDLWWVEGEGDNKGMLKVMDLGSLEELKSLTPDKQSAKIRRDLLLASIYLFAMLTGKKPNYSSGELREKPAQITKWIDESDLTWGTKHILRRLLHWNPEFRYKTAESIENDLRFLSACWDSDIPSLQEICSKRIQPLNGKTDLSSAEIENLTITKGGIDILIHKQHYPDDITRKLKEWVDILVEENEYLDRGQKLAKGRSYAEAREILRRGMEFGEYPAILRRWGYISEALSLSTTDEAQRLWPQYEQAVGVHNSSHYLHALELWKELLNGPATEIIGFLIADTQMYHHYSEAINKQNLGAYQDAASNFRSALEYCRKLRPEDQRFIQQHEIGDFLQMAQEAERMEQSEGISRKLLEEARSLTPLDHSRAITLLNEAYEANPASSELPGMIRDTLSSLIMQRKYADTEEWCTLAERLPQIDDELRSVVMKANGLRRSEQFLFWRRGPSLVTELREVWASSTLKIDIKDQILGLIERVWESPILLEQNETLDGFSLLCHDMEEYQLETRFKDKAEANRRAEQESANHFANILLSKGWGLLDFEDPAFLKTWILQQPAVVCVSMMENNELRLKKAKQILAELESRSGYSEKNQTLISQFKEAVLERESLFAAWRTGTDGDAGNPPSPQKDDLLVKWAKIQRVEVGVVAAQESGIDNASSESLKNFLSTQLISFIRQCWQYLGSVSRDDIEVKGLLTLAIKEMDKLDGSSWQAMYRVTHEDIESARAILSDARKLAEEGKTTEAAEKLFTVEGMAALIPEFAEVKVYVLQGLVFSKWLELNEQELDMGNGSSAVLRAIREYITNGLPLTYISKSKVESYLFRIWGKALKTLEKEMQTPYQESYLGALKKMYEIDATCRMANLPVAVLHQKYLPSKS